MVVCNNLNFFFERQQKEFIKKRLARNQQGKTNNKKLQRRKRRNTPTDPVQSTLNLISSVKPVKGHSLNQKENSDKKNFLLIVNQVIHCLSNVPKIKKNYRLENMKIVSVETTSFTHERTEFNELSGVAIHEEYFQQKRNPQISGLLIPLPDHRMNTAFAPAVFLF